MGPNHEATFVQSCDFFKTFKTENRLIFVYQLFLISHMTGSKTLLILRTLYGAIKIDITYTYLNSTNLHQN